MGNDSYDKLGDGIDEKRGKMATPVTPCSQFSE